METATNEKIHQGRNNYYPTFNVNPVEKWIEAVEENKKLYE